MLPELKVAAGISHRESGSREAPALVLLHGIGSTSAAWWLQYGPLGESMRVLGWDAPGYGASRALPGEAPPAEAYARALAALLDALGVERAILGSNSWGTATAIAFAKLHPRRARALVLGGPANGFAALPSEEREKRIAERVERISKLGPKAMREQDAGRLVAPGTREQVLDWVRSPEGVTVAGYSQAARMMGSVDCAREIASVGCPVTVVSGARDIVTPPEQNAMRIAAAARNAKLVMVPDCGHLPHLEFPEVFNDVVRDALRAVTA